MIVIQDDGAALALGQLCQSICQRRQTYFAVRQLGRPFAALVFIQVLAGNCRFILAHIIDTQIMRNAMQPGGNTRLLAAPGVGMSPQAQECFLGDVFSILAVTQHAEGIVTDRLQMLFDGRFIGTGIAGLNCGHQLLIICHFKNGAPTACCCLGVVAGPAGFC